MSRQQPYTYVQTPSGAAMCIYYPQVSERGTAQSAQPVGGNLSRVSPPEVLLGTLSN